MGGQVQQVSSASHGSLFAGPHAGDVSDAAMQRWLQSAGLQHLASPTASSSIYPRLLPNLLMQDYARHGMQTTEDRQKMFRMMKPMNGDMELAGDPYMPPTYGSGQRNGVDGLSSPELRGEIGSGILDLHAIDDIELLSEDVVHEPFEVSPFVTVTERGYENEADVLWSTNKPPSSKQRSFNESNPMRASSLDKDIPGKDGSTGLARIKVVVRKRPLNKKEVVRKEEDIVAIDESRSSLTVHEPKLKVDLTAYVEKHDFVFDAVLDDQVSNDEVYQVTVKPIIPTIFQRTKATCFAYGQTGSGKTYTMQPLPLRACQDILDLMQHPTYRNERLQLWLSFFEIYGGKLYDLLTDRRKLCMREDGRQQVCIVGLKEFPVSNVEVVKDYIEKGNASRSTGTTGANEESSRSHAILQLVIKKHSNKKEEQGGKLVGKFSFIDLAGSERGADTTDNDRQTRIEGAEINKSLLALKECIRALDHEQGHIPFRGSKLTEVLRDSFVGDSRTVMISCISPNTGSCEHTLNTLRYADRVKGLSKNSNSKRDPSPNMVGQTQRESANSTPSTEMETMVDYRVPEVNKQAIEQSNWQPQRNEQQGWLPSQNTLEQADARTVTFGIDRNRASARDTMSNSFSYQGDTMSNNFNDQGDTMSNSFNDQGYPTVDRNKQDRNSSSSRQKMVKDEKPGRPESRGVNWELKSERNVTLRGSFKYKEEKASNSILLRSTDSFDTSVTLNGYDNQISAILEEEEDLIAAHRLEVEDTMELVREEMKLLTDVDQPGSRIDDYVSQLSYLLSRKAAGIVNLQARLARFQRHLKEQEIISQNMNMEE